VVAPGVGKPGQSCAAPVDYLSLYPTLCELTGLPVPDHVKGPSLVPLLRDPQAAWPHLAVCSHGRGNHAVRDSNWRYIRYADGSEELYHHAEDPGEYRNLATVAEHAAIKKRLATALPSDEAAAISGKKAGAKKKKKSAQN
jgi:arylsulfatase A-like enzyme